MSQSDPRRDAFDGMMEYGRSGIRYAFLLNGGAILALLAFVGSIVGEGNCTSLSALADALVPAFGAFILGVTTATLSTYYGYLNFQGVYDGLSGHLARTRRVAIVAAFVAVAAFIAGAALAAVAVAAI